MPLFIHKMCLPQAFTLCISTHPSKTCLQLPQGAATEHKSIVFLSSPKEIRQDFTASSLVFTSNSCIGLFGSNIFFQFEGSFPQ